MLNKTNIAGKIRYKIQIVAAAITIMLAFGAVTYANVSLDATPSSINFGSQSVSSTSTSQAVILTNYNKHQVTIYSVSVSIAQFSYSGPPLPVNLNPGQALTGSVTFTPSAVQAYSGTLIFTRSNGPTISIGLSGIGTAPSTTSTTVAPAITTQPASQTVIAGYTASFTVAATGTSPMTYQWSKNGAAISGATSSAYTTPAETTADNNAQFAVAVSNSAGSATSNAAVLTVTNPVVAPAITTQPANQSVIAGKTATFTVAATGTAPLTFQWSKNGAAISGATSSAYTTPAETTADNNAQFTVAVSNSAGSATSTSATLTVGAATLLLNSSTSSLSFGNVNVSGSSTQSITLANAGNSAVTISNVTVSGAGFNAAGVSSGLIMAPGQTTTLTATFAPSSAGSVTGSVLVASNATNSPDAILLSGNGVAVVNHSVALSWSPSTSSVMGYNTYSSTQSGGPYTKLNSTPVAAMSYTSTAVLSGQTYYFVVTSVDSSNMESGYSAEVSATIP